MNGVSWSQYELFVPDFLGPPELLPRAQAMLAFKQIIGSKDARKQQLRDLVAHDDLQLRDDDVSIARLNNWFVGRVTENPDNAGRLLPEWYSVVRDIGLFLRDVAIARNPGLRWELFVWGAKNIVYQRHVLMGFNVSYAKFNYDFEGGVVTMGYRAIAGLPVGDADFVKWLGDVKHLHSSTAN